MLRNYEVLSTILRSKDRMYKVIWKEPGECPKTTWEPASNIPGISKREYHMNRTLKGTEGWKK